MSRALALLVLLVLLSGCESSGIRYIKKLAREKPLETRIFRDPRTKLLGIERSFDPIQSSLEGQPEAWEEVRLERRQVLVEAAFTELVVTQRAFYGRLPSAPTFTLVTLEGERIGATPFARCRSAVMGVIVGPDGHEWQLGHEPKAPGIFVDRAGWVVDEDGTLYAPLAQFEKPLVAKLGGERLRDVGGHAFYEYSEWIQVGNLARPESVRWLNVLKGDLRPPISTRHYREVSRLDYSVTGSRLSSSLAVVRYEDGLFAIEDGFGAALLSFGPEVVEAVAAPMNFARLKTRTDYRLVDVHDRKPRVVPQTFTSAEAADAEIRRRSNLMAAEAAELWRREEENYRLAAEAYAREQEKRRAEEAADLKRYEELCDKGDWAGASAVALKRQPGYYAPPNAWTGRYTFAQSRLNSARLTAEQAAFDEATRKAKEREEAAVGNKGSIWENWQGPSPTQADTGAWDRYVLKQWLNGSSTGVYHNRAPR